MDNILVPKQGFDTYLIALVAILIFLLIIILIISKSYSSKKIRKRYEELNIKYNDLKTIPLTFKMNKAIAIAKVNEEISNEMEKCEDIFENISSVINQLSHLSIEIDDEISNKKNKQVNILLTDFEELIEQGNEKSKTLEKQLDLILEKETQQRNKVNVFKDNFRNIKNYIQTNSHLYSISMIKLEAKISKVEELFSIFEEWMYASEFNKTKDVLIDIENNINELIKLGEKLPEFIKETKGDLPSLIDELKRDFLLCNQKGIYLNNLMFEDNLNAIYETIKLNLANIENCEINDVKEDLNTIYLRINQLKEQIEFEENSYYEVKKYLKEKYELFKVFDDSIKYIQGVLPKVEKKFGLETLGEKLNTYIKSLDEVKNDYEEIKVKFENPDTSFASLQIDVKEQNLKLDLLIQNLNELRDKLNQACIDEERAKKQIIKLQLISNEMRVKTLKNKLPSISKSFYEDLNKANDYITEIKLLLEEVPLNIVQLNSKLNLSIDFVYKLYNDLNKVVGMALMVENTIVFANKYRSKNNIIDSELTRAELLYRTGEFTQALEISITAVEKIFPNSYSKLLKENDFAK